MKVISEPKWTFFENDDSNSGKAIMSFDVGDVNYDCLIAIEDGFKELLNHFATNADNSDSEDFDRYCISKEEWDANDLSINGIEPHIARPIDIASVIIDGDYSLNELREIAEHLKVYCDCQESELPFEDVE